MSATKEKFIMGICDNEVTNLKWIPEILGEQIQKLHLSQDWEVHPFTNGEILLEVAKNLSFKLLFLDIEMPICNGFELAQKILNCLTVPNFLWDGIERK